MPASRAHASSTTPSPRPPPPSSPAPRPVAAASSASLRPAAASSASPPPARRPTARPAAACTGTCASRPPAARPASPASAPGSSWEPLRRARGTMSWKMVGAVVVQEALRCASAAPPCLPVLPALGRHRGGVVHAGKPSAPPGTYSFPHTAASGLAAVHAIKLHHVVRHAALPLLRFSQRSRCGRGCSPPTASASA